MWSIPSYGLPQTLPHGSWTYSKHTPRLTSVPSAFASLVASVRNPTSKGPVQSKKNLLIVCKVFDLEIDKIWKN